MFPPLNARKPIGESKWWRRSGFLAPFARSFGKRSAQRRTPVNSQGSCQLARKLFNQYKRKTAYPVEVRALATLYAALKATYCYPMTLREFMEMFEKPALTMDVARVYKRMMMEVELKPQFEAAHVR